MNNRPIVAASIVAAIVTGCATAPAGRLGTADTEQALIRVAHDDFAGVTPEIVRYVDRSEVNEYVRYVAGGRQAEIVYIGVLTHRHAIEYRDGLRPQLDHWVANAGREREIDEARKLTVGHRLYQFRRYRLAVEDRRCVVFWAEWNEIPEDRQFRPADLVLGIYCRAPGEAMALTDAETFIRSILIDEVGVPGSYPPDLPLQSADAGGTPAIVGDGVGNLRFPYKITLPFSEEHDGEGRID